MVPMTDRNNWTELQEYSRKVGSSGQGQASYSIPFHQQTPQLLVDAPTHPVSHTSNSAVPWNHSQYYQPSLRQNLYGRSTSQPTPNTDGSYTDWVFRQDLQPDNTYGESAPYIGDTQNTGRYCANCSTTETPEWRRDPLTHATLCNACRLYQKTHGQNRPLNLIVGQQETSDPPEDYHGHRCTHCGTIKTPTWRHHPTTHEILCNACGMYARNNKGQMRDLQKPRGTRRRRAQSLPHRH
ncbi:hypothetical protein DL96DRAFT_571385 [Flagelloscypha sp. PMI_526]|nr:hypothetical protein DL96DRAFT_571385 [Flagelloscypha sp. PMI_526]